MRKIDVYITGENRFIIDKVYVLIITLVNADLIFNYRIEFNFKEKSTDKTVLFSLKMLLN